MEQNKFEERIRAQFETRKIHPSTKAWQDLESRLDNSQKKTQIKRLWFLGMAASVVGVLLLSSLFFKTEFANGPVKHNSVVDIKTPNVQKTEAESSSGSVAVNTDEETEHLDGKQDKGTSFKKNKAKQGHGVNRLKSMAVANKNQSEMVQLETVDTLIDAEVKRAEASGLAEQPTKQTVNDDYLEALLKDAENDIRIKQSINSKTKHTVDAKRLLEHVENDIEHSFREKVFDAVKTGFNKVRTAVAERNK